MKIELCFFIITDFGGSGSESVSTDTGATVFDTGTISALLVLVPLRHSRDQLDFSTNIRYGY